VIDFSWWSLLEKPELVLPPKMYASPESVMHAAALSLGDGGVPGCPAAQAVDC
jgi:hypothetical protein